MNAEELKAGDAWVTAWSQEARPLRLPAAWSRRWSAVVGEFKAVFWSWS